MSTRRRVGFERFEIFGIDFGSELGGGFDIGIGGDQVAVRSLRADIHEADYVHGVR